MGDLGIQDIGMTRTGLIVLQALFGAWLGLPLYRAQKVRTLVLHAEACQILDFGTALRELT